MKVLGEFLVKTPNIRVCDPCYARGVSWDSVIGHCATGEWTALAEYQNGSPLTVYAHHNSFDNFSDYNNCWQEFPFDLDIDSGQAGIFDDSLYRKDEDSFYQECCEATNSADRGGIVKEGVVTGNPWGDGTYKAFGLENENGEVVAIKIEYNEEYYDDDDYYSDEWDEEESLCDDDFEEDDDDDF